MTTTTRSLEYTMGDRTYTVRRYCDHCGEPIDMEFHGMSFYNRCACRRINDMERRINSLRKKGLTDASMLSMRFENDKQYNPSICNKARAYAAHFGDPDVGNVGLLLTGGVGTGKTFYAACIANALIDRGIFVFMTNLSRIIGSGFDEDYKNALRTIESADLVIFDDIGAERDTDFAWERIFDAIDTRVRSGKPMIVTTNLSPKSMAECQDIQKQRVYDRILGACVTIPVSGPSIRKKQHVDGRERFKRMLES